MSIQQSDSTMEDFQLDKSLKFDYHGNKYSLFIGGLNPNTDEDAIVEKIQQIGVTEIIDVKIIRDKRSYSKRYAEVNLFLINSVKIMKDKYSNCKNVIPIRLVLYLRLVVTKLVLIKLLVLY